MLSSAAWQPCGGAQWLTSRWGCHTAWWHCGVGFACGMGTGLSPSPPGGSQAVQCRGGPFPSGPCAYREWAPSRFCPRGLSCASGSITFPVFLPSMLGFISPGTRRGTCANQRMKPALVKPEKKSKLKGEEEKLSLCKKMDSCCVPLELTGAADRDLSLDGSFSHLAHLMLPHLTALPAKLL